jgi:hypothetical protein
VRGSETPEKRPEPKACASCRHTGFRDLTVHATLKSGADVVDHYAVPCDCPKGSQIAAGQAPVNGRSLTVHGWADYYRSFARVAQVIVDPEGIEALHGRAYADLVASSGRPLTADTLHLTPPPTRPTTTVEAPEASHYEPQEWT